MSYDLKEKKDLNISLSGIFSNSHFERICNGEPDTFIDTKISKYKDNFDFRDTVPRKKILESFYSYLLSEYRCEYIYKNIIAKKILLGIHSLNTSTLLNEFKVGSSWADCILINGEATLYEIKTELDSPERLRDQLAEYKRAFKNIYLVIHHSQVEKYRNILQNSSVGLLALNERFQLSERKEAKENIENLDVETMFKILRKKEYSNIINDAFGSTPDVPNMAYFTECLNLAKKLSPLDFHNFMTEQLRKRKPQEKQILSSNEIPNFLVNICISIDPNETGYSHLFSFLNQSPPQRMN
jgi:hypothetical protein